MAHSEALTTADVLVWLATLATLSRCVAQCSTTMRCCKHALVGESVHSALHPAPFLEGCAVRQLGCLAHVVHPTGMPCCMHVAHDVDGLRRLSVADFDHAHSLPEAQLPTRPADSRPLSCSPYPQNGFSER